ncbi:MAG: two-component sensor histidine kinase/Tfp pilus assembly protein PilF [Flavobacteriaceae bacterium]
MSGRFFGLLNYQPVLEAFKSSRRNQFECLFCAIFRLMIQHSRHELIRFLQNNTSLRILLVPILLFTFSGFITFSQTSSSSQSNLKNIESLIEQKKEKAVHKCIDSLEINDPSFYAEHLEKILRYKGKCVSISQDYTQAFMFFFDGLKLAEARGNEIEIAQIKLELGLIFLQFNEPNLANKIFQEAEDLFLKLDRKELYARCGYLRAVSQKRLGAFKLSNEILEKVKAVYLQNNDSLGLAKTYNAIGLNYKNLKDVEQGIPQYENAISIFSALDSKPNLAKAYNNLANIYQVDGQWELAKLNHQNSIEIKELRQDKLGIAASYINISVIYKRTNGLPKALEYGNRSLKLLEQIGPGGNKVKTEVYGLMSELHERMGNPTEALKFSRLEHELLAQSRVEDEEMLIQLFEKKQDVKFYTISDSLIKNQKILQNKIELAEDKNEELTKEKGYVLTASLIIISALSILIAIVIYWRFLSARKMKNELIITNEELSKTRISKEEKEVLLHEIHHRVNNNMQIMSSLIRLQSNKYEDDEIKNLFTVTQHRIKSMALVHEYLYQSDNFERLEIRGYLTELTNHLIDSYEGDMKIKRSINISVDQGSIESIIPLGLIVNEIITNSLKHAFNSTGVGTISIIFSELSNSNYELLISDDGDGDTSESAKSTNPLGLDLIESLIQQIDGKYELTTTGGYHYKIILPKI